MDTWKRPAFSPDHPLAGCEQKVWRAHEHFELLQVEIETWGREVESATFRTELKPRSNDTLLTMVDTVILPPLRFAAIIGDIVHNLRSTLDHLVFELAFLGLRGETIPERTAFPCSTTKANWNSSYVQDRLLEGVLKKHRAMLYKAQPCYRRKDTAQAGAVRRRKRSPAADLNQLWTEDKHRMIQATAVAPSYIGPKLSNWHHCRPEGQFRVVPGFLGEPLKANAKVLEIPMIIEGTDPKVDVKAEIGGEVSLGNGLPVRKALADIGDFVAGALSYFAPEFETPTARALWGLPRGSWVEGKPLRPRRAILGTWTIETPE